MGSSDDRQKVMFAERIYRDIFFYKHLAVSVLIFKSRNPWLIFRKKPAENLIHIHLCDSFWRVFQAVICHIQPKGVHNLSKKFFYLFYLFIR